MDSVKKEEDPKLQVSPTITHIGYKYTERELNQKNIFVSTVTWWQKHMQLGGKKTTQKNTKGRMSEIWNFPCEEYHLRLRKL